MAELNTTGDQLDAAWRVLNHRWDSLHGNWSDAPRREFQNDYWLPLEKQVSATQEEMKRLAGTIASARRVINSLSID